MDTRDHKNDKKHRSRRQYPAGEKVRLLMLHLVVAGNLGIVLIGFAIAVAPAGELARGLKDTWTPPDERDAVVDFLKRMNTLTTTPFANFSAFNPDPRHVERDKRTRKYHVE
jgi:hypothetical protein